MAVGIGTVSAETASGTLGSSAWNSSTYNIGYGSSFTTYKLHTMYIQNFENSGDFRSLINWNTADKFTFDAGAPPGAQTSVTFRLANATQDGIGGPLKKDGRIIGTGQIGYQRYYNGANPPVEQNNGYIYVYADNWNVSTDNGLTYIYLEYDSNLLYNLSVHNAAGGWAPANMGAFIALGGGAEGGLYTMNKAVNTWASYIATKPSGLSIQGTVNKTSDGSTYYNSRAYITQSNGSVITSDTVANPNTFSFNVPQDQIIICVLSTNAVWFNSSLLFTPGGVTPTPTPTPTPTVTLNPGEFWLTFSAEDATTGGLIPGAEIDIYSEFAGTWNNATTTSGERTIASSQNHVYDAYGSASGYTDGSALDKVAYPNQNYLVKLFPSSGLPNVPGYINLFVSVTERETGSPISGVSVTVSTPGSYTVNGETDSTGSEVFSTSNSSVKYITVSKSGYKSETRTITTPASGSYNAALQMSRVLVTTQPTSYIPPGGVTPQITVDPRSSTEKDQDMMNMIRDAGPNLIQLAIVVTMISLLGLMTKGFGK